MSWEETSVLAAAAVTLVLWSVWVAASRLDRLHRKVGASRAVIDAQLLRRATVSAELASSGLLDPPSAVIVGEAARAALQAGGSAAAEGPTVPQELGALLAAGPGAVVGTQSPTEARGAEHSEGARPVPWTSAGRRAQAGERGRVESELTDALRAVLDCEDEIVDLRADPSGAELLDELSAAWYRVQLSRRFHNEAVAQTQRVRRGRLVRLLRLAGHAPEPATLELDDEWPAALGRPGGGLR
ncbi:hypothetical protein [Cellulomonas soli]|uniref:Membrane protein n=1 Tax=Cellulomonas soli TaxID=931535 RepID=A0A512PA89_9CELL|nr:hypothetical protein [Cellulomonas soli]NYI60561.1 hypothetical protein [Cellulomonas soli]GEP68076.1 membrane protein [Cellulomonas soli]